MWSLRTAVYNDDNERKDEPDKEEEKEEAGMGIKNGKVSWKMGAWGPQKAPSGVPGGNAPGGGQGAKPSEAEAEAEAF